jgi:hypothetical protein
MSFTLSSGPRPAQLFSGPSLAGPMTILYFLRFDIHQTLRTRSLHLYPPGTGGTAVLPFSSSSTTRRATVEILEPASTRASTN